MKGVFRVVIILILFSTVWVKKMRWCTVSEPEQRKCADLAKALVVALAPAASTSFGRLSCVRTYSTADCLCKIRDNKADLVTLDAGELYSAVKQFGLTAVAKEIYSDGGCILAVAVVKNTSSLDIRSLKGTKSCHSGARWTSGWSLPLGHLLSRNYLPWTEGQTLSQAVSTFFNASCVPGAAHMGLSLCTQCQGERSYVPQRNFYCETSHNEPFYHNQGALRCLQSGAGDVAFVDHTALDSIDDSEKDYYLLLCTDGTQAPLSSFRKCNLGRGPGSGVVTRVNNRNLARKFLVAAQMMFGWNGQERQRFQLFSSSGYGRRDLLFSDVTKKLSMLQEDIDISQVLGLDYVALIKGLRHEGSSLEDSVVRWCCISHAEQEKCEHWALSIKSYPLVCVKASSMSDCIEQIKRNKADAVSLDATHSFLAGKCGLVPVVTEYYGTKCELNDREGGSFEAKELQKLDQTWLWSIGGSEKDLPSVYGVAVARHSSRSVYIGKLGGRRSCHGFVYSPAGWILPVRHTLSSEHNHSAFCQPNKVLSEVFWKGCMPGGEGSLCKVCVGGTEEVATKRCSNNHDERYYGNMGALRCLVGDPSGKSFGDVAFMEYHNLESNIEYLNNSGWANGWLSQDFELLCVDGQRAPLMEWKTCNLGAIPPNTVMTRPVLTARIYEFLLKSQEPQPNSEFTLFESQQYGESDLLFKDATKCLVHTSHMDYRTILGEEFYLQAENIFNCTHSDILQFCNQDVCSIF